MRLVAMQSHLFASIKQPKRMTKVYEQQQYVLHKLLELASKEQQTSAEAFYRQLRIDLSTTLSYFLGKGQ